MKNKVFYSPSLGKLGIEEVVKKIADFMAGEPDFSYKVIIGTDSGTPKKGEVDFITAVVIHRIGRGGIYLWQRNHERKVFSLRERIYKEASYSLVAAENLLSEFKKNGILDFNPEIHIDIGMGGETRVLISEVVGMIRGSGFEVKTKPEAYGASTVADRHT